LRYTCVKAVSNKVQENCFMATKKKAAAKKKAAPKKKAPAKKKAAAKKKK